jgi:hypothetical protein
MGWLYMQSFDRHSGPRRCLDAQFTCQCDDVRLKVLRSALVRMRTYLRHPRIRARYNRHSVVVIVCLVRYNPVLENRPWARRALDRGLPRTPVS